MEKLLELVFELRGRLRDEAHYDEDNRLWNLYLSYTPLIGEYEHLLLKEEAEKNGTKTQ